MDVKKEVNNILNALLELPMELQDIVVEDLIETAKSRVATMKRIAG